MVSVATSGGQLCLQFIMKGESYSFGWNTVTVMTVSIPFLVLPYVESIQFLCTLMLLAHVGFGLFIVLVNTLHSSGCDD